MLCCHSHCCWHTRQQTRPAGLCLKLCAPFIVVFCPALTGARNFAQFDPFPALSMEEMNFQNLFFRVCIFCCWQKYNHAKEETSQRPFRFPYTPPFPVSFSNHFLADDRMMRYKKIIFFKTIVRDFSSPFREYKISLLFRALLNG